MLTTLYTQTNALSLLNNWSDAIYAMSYDIDFQKSWLERRGNVAAIS